jgi:hypothetical protein
MELTLRMNSSTRLRADYGTDTPFLYDVDGLSEGRWAQVGNETSRYWQFRFDCESRPVNT